ncbi:hypothetical protein Sjap_018557 [Stephania japonica]|uniref:Uncharacterized protein n=1 Tax=Stephania japonica TaxID=461633 RepID=A0AAP0NJI0_9MAGN
MAERSGVEVTMAKRTGAEETEDQTRAKTMMAEQRRRCRSRGNDGGVDRSNDGRVENDGGAEGTTTVEQQPPEGTTAEKRGRDGGAH